MVKLLFKISLLVGVITISLFAQGGEGCIVQKYGKEYKWDKKNKKYLENTCNVEMYVFWCHNKNAKGYQKTLCGGEKFYRKAKTFKPGEKKFNKYTIPIDATVKVGACVQSPLYKHTKSVHKFNPDGSYECATSGISKKLVDNEVILRCPSGKTKLLEIQGVFGPKKNVLKIKDTQSGILHTINTLHKNRADVNSILCQEASTGKGSVLGRLRSFVRNYCKDHPEECKKNKSQSKGGNGVRG